MKIDNFHPEYFANLSSWELCRDAYLGESAVKLKSEIYLPKLHSQPDASYQAYLSRAVFYTFMSNTVNGRLGQIMRKHPQLDFPDNLIEWTQEVTNTGRSLVSLISQVIEELLKCGRVGILCDFKDNAPYFSLYFAEDIPNWKVDENNNLIEVFLREEVFVESKSNTIDKEIHIRKYFIDEEDGSVKMELHRTWPSKELLGEATPLSMGRNLTKIPFVFISPNSIDETIEKPPMLDVALMSMAIYRNSADLEQILHTLAVPTPYGTGIDEDEMEDEFVVGPNEFKSFRNEGAKLGMLEFSGAGVEALRQSIEDKMAHISAIGGTVTFGGSKIVEQAETARLRMATETAALSSLVNNTERGINKLLKVAAEWAGWSDDIGVRINRDFLDNMISPDMIRAVNEAEAMGMISEEAAFDLRQKMEMYPDGWTYKKERKLRDKMSIPEKVPTSLAGSISQAENPKNNNKDNKVQGADEE